MEALSEEQKNTLDKLAQKHDLELVVLFGSRAAGKARSDSDYDIGYISGRNLDHKEERELFIGMLSVIQPHDERLLDLTNIKGTNPLLRYHIAVNSRLLYGKLQRYHAFHSLAFKQYVDTYKLRQLEKIMIEKRQKQFMKLYG